MKKLFRKEAEDAFKSHFSTNKQLSRITVSTKLMLAVLFLGIFMYFSWIKNGNIAKTAELEGVVFPSAGIETAYVLHDGIISGVTVRVGDRVEMGDVLAVVPNNDAIGSINYSMKMNDSDQEDDFDRKKKEIDKFDYMKDSFIRSPADGYVISILQKGRSVKEGDVFAIIAADSKEFGREHVLCFLPTENKNGIKKGCEVQISLDYAQREKYGYINGYVYDIMDDIITKKDAIANYEFYNIPSMLEEDKTYIPVVINFDENLEYESGLSWSIATSGSIEPEPGTKCKCSVIIGKERPYDWLFGGGMS